MAKHTVIELIDDLDGSEASENVRFMLDGTEYEIDLAAGNADALRNTLAPYVKAGRKYGRAARTSTPRVSTQPAVDSKAVRRWAADNGIQVGTLGRVPANVVEQYLAAQG